MSHRRWVYPSDGGEPYEVGSDWTDAPKSTGDLSKFAYDNLKQTDGTVTDTPKKLREWVSRNGLAHMDDFKEHTPKFKAEQAREYAKQRRDDVGRAIYQLESRRGKRR